MSAQLPMFSLPRSPQPVKLPRPRAHGVAVHRMGVLSYVVLHHDDGRTEDLDTVAAADADRVADEWASRLDVPRCFPMFDRV